MARVTVKLSRDHLQGLIRSPLQGLTELIWNALDADATEVAADVERGGIETIRSVTITDNGHGMTEEEASRTFGALGESWKRSAAVTREKRRVLHGSNGKGRYAAFGIGRRVSWSSVAQDDTGERKQIVISGSQESLDEFDLPPVVPTSERSGTRVRIEAIHPEAESALDRPSVIHQLATTFALYLESYPAEIRWQGQLVDPKDLQDFREEYDLTEALGDGRRASVVVIEWKKPVRRALYLCDADGMALHDMLPSVQAPGFDFTAYVRWQGFRELGHDILLADLGHEAMAPVIEAARDALRRHFKERIEAKRSEMVRRWKAERSYPYAGEPANEIEASERELFEVVAVSAAKSVEAAETSARKLSLRLIKEALETNPSNLRTVLAEVVDLSEEQLKELAQLLQRTPLTSVIVTARMITDRLAFINGLDALLFDKAPKQQTLERRQLHRILAEETWLFGEEYALTGDDDRLLVVLRKHLELLGEDVELAGTEPLTRMDGTEAVPDLVLSRPMQNRDNRLEHLVVELKRPNVTIRRKELQQIEDYAFAVGKDERFNQPNVHWEFWIIGNKLDDYVTEEATSPDRPPGVVKQTKRYRVIAKTWAEVISDAKHRLKFLSDSLQYRSGRDEGIEYLRRAHEKLLPDALKKDES
ncbi:ATP-binding protein [Actinoallomurus acaciae]|uniref:ATP-binding protein n=1 Tax=Actinoallomurus acaciae TaxID=502577 RepID=A0ABV5YF29_9ACTN